MSDRTRIEWTRGEDGKPGTTWNPVTGCTEVSSGCDHCYAKTFAERWRGVPGHYYEQGFDLQLRPEKLLQPRQLVRPRRIFVNSMSDLFHDAIPDSYIASVFATMAITERHTYQVLTKRHGRMRALLNNPRFWVNVAEQADALAPNEDRPSFDRHLLPNVWIGVSAENAQWAKARGDALRGTPAAVRFFSCEPLLGPIEDLDLSGIGWVIVGGESGRGARPMHPDWVRGIRNQCEDNNIPFFFKQWGEWMSNFPSSEPMDTPYDRYVHYDTGDLLTEEAATAHGGRFTMVRRVGKHKTGRELDKEIWDQFPVPSISGRLESVLAQELVDVLRNHTHRGSREFDIQDSIERVLRAKGYQVERERRLSERDRPDFLINEHVVIEVKMKASGTAVLAQIGRYAEHRQVRAIVVASPRHSTLGQIPELIHGVPIYPVSLPGVGLSL
ncbi:bacteriophage protein gp37 [Mycobacteroides abscessus subsp. abscessus]|uniref:DUF5131 family protein n=1 Tax=Mycobacteroides abscessus TaxID=36809 RepID=UPI00092ABF5A|nr:phage Gp37/Gp68 family protein [Mycobacteroides abscessus]SIJ20642.1 bacteriophage protein gp37 [Mycobacteroides abscessus subsp. abscessus]SLH39607.1 bacteriophage protein gp37 [Mycobacteroides abscessus subsp. abscessus]